MVALATSPRRASARPIEPPGEAAIDLAHLARYTLGDRALEREVLDLFAGQLPLTLASLRAAATPRDWRIATHTLKGSARAVGAHRLGHLAEAAERHADEPEHWAAAVTVLAAEVEALVAFVRRTGNRHAASAERCA